MYKLISLDLDGTLFNSKQQISERNFKTVEACHNLGVETVIATGRPPRFTFPCLPEFLTKSYVICYNGAKIFKDKELVFEVNIQSEVIQMIIDYINDSFKLAFEYNDMIYSNFTLSDEWGVIRNKSLDSLNVYDKVCKVLILNDEAFPYEEFYRKFSKYCNIFQTDNGNLIEIVDKSISKFHAIEFIAREIGISVEEVVAFGDDFNDIEILNRVGYGVAMANAHEDIIKQSHHCTLSNNEDGVAVVLEELFGV